MKALAALITIAAMSFCPTISRGCQNPCSKMPLEEAFARSALVFYGTVQKKVAGTFSDQLTFEVNKTWKGKPGARPVVTAEGTTCDPFGDDAAVGDKCLIFAVPRGSASPSAENKDWWTGYCAGSLKFEYVIKEEDYLPKLDQLSRGK